MAAVGDEVGEAVAVEVRQLDVVREEVDPSDGREGPPVRIPGESAVAVAEGQAELLAAPPGEAEVMISVVVDVTDSEAEMPRKGSAISPSG